MNGDNQPLVTIAPIEFEERPVEIQDIREITARFKGIEEIYLQVIRETPKDVNM